MNPLEDESVLKELQLPTPVPGELKEVVKFLYTWMPESDSHSLPPGFFIRHAIHALKARAAYTWASAVPWTVFLNDVVPYASLSEPRETFRLDPQVGKFFSELLDGHKTEVSSTADVAVLLNKLSWTIVDPPIQFLAAPPCTINSYAPFETMQRHNSSCTGLAGNVCYRMYVCVLGVCVCMRERERVRAV
jgi:hypothetical protein